ncbi:RNA polymerase sigma-70 factor (ECF subfamily) [Pontibacter mucosus]|uniref:RNA polymerase sigma-70 factor (ECF subfamily) n=1 Tax=Pontibacter mucosus TaxID=1649266 RepID=A0A2T5YGK4_9BACT|nr:sigma-70 family RNA polymerase sigma factor [Pontibacter mucosus]PTX18447.1 RNA polymerase sigma-70 factor (ECF subfamily) [Pontibacter mucosus]
MEEQEIWKRFREGSEHEFTLLYRRYAPVMLRYGHRLSSDPDLVKDCVQQVFFQVWKSRQNLSTPPSVRNYLLKAFRCELAKKATFISRFQSLPDDSQLGTETSYEAELIKLQTSDLDSQRISQLLTKLPERQREVIFLKYYTGLQYDEMADIMGIDQKSVYKLTYKAIDKLHKLFHVPEKQESTSLRKRVRVLASSLAPSPAEEAAPALEKLPASGKLALNFD